MNAECVTEPKTFVFKNEICGVTFKWFPLGFDRNFGEATGQQTYPFPALCALTATPAAQSDSGGRVERKSRCDELKETAALRAAHARLDLTVPALGPERWNRNTDDHQRSQELQTNCENIPNGRLS